MRKKLSLLFVGMLAAGAVTVGAASPAYACHELVADGDDPIYRFACNTAHSVPEPGPTVDYYYWWATSIAHNAYCAVSPHC